MLHGFLSDVDFPHHSLWLPCVNLTLRCSFHLQAPYIYPSVSWIYVLMLNSINILKSLFNPRQHFCDSNLVVFFYWPPIVSPPTSFFRYHPIAFPSLCSLHSPSPSPHSSSAPPSSSSPPCVTGGASEQWEKLRVGSFFPLCVNVFTGWTTHSFHLCRPCGSNGTILPPTPHSDLSCRSGSLTCGGTGASGGDRQPFSVESLVPVASSSVFFRCSYNKWLFFFSRRRKGF